MSGAFLVSFGAYQKKLGTAVPKFLRTKNKQGGKNFGKKEDKKSRRNGS